MNAFASHPDPAADYADAAARIEATCAWDTSDINNQCATQFFTHGHTTERAIVFFHGLTNSPRQFVELGERFHRLGYNVYIPRLPQHGMKDRLTRSLSRLTVDALARATENAVDIGRGLGEHLTVAGLSLGGVLAGWAAAERADVDLAVLISPAFSAAWLNVDWVEPLSKLVLRLPDWYKWWDVSQRERLGPDHAYPRVSAHAVTHTFRLGAHVYRQAANHKPRAKSILVVTNATDFTVNNRATARVVERWRQHGAHVRTFEFTGLPAGAHDIIDLTIPEEQINVVYPKLIELIDGEVALAR